MKIRHKATWHVLAPYADLPDYDEDEVALDVDTEIIYVGTVDGVEWATDRYMLIRTDLLTGNQLNSQHRVDLPSARIATVLDNARADGPPRQLSPWYLLMATQHGWTLEPAAGVWRIVVDGELIGVIQPTREDNPGGHLPGDDLRKEQAIVPLLEGRGPNVWLTATAIIAELDALAAKDLVAQAATIEQLQAKASDTAWSLDVDRQGGA